jgi:hypothetical protein
MAFVRSVIFSLTEAGSRARYQYLRPPYDLSPGQSDRRIGRFGGHGRAYDLVALPISGISSAICSAAVPE